MSKAVAFFQGLIVLTISGAFIAGLFNVWGFGPYSWGICITLVWVLETILLVHSGSLRGPQFATIFFTSIFWIGLLSIF